MNRPRNLQERWAESGHWNTEATSWVDRHYAGARLRGVCMCRGDGL